MTGKRVANYESSFNRINLVVQHGRKHNPVLDNPALEINRKIKDIGERLLDFLPKMAKALSVPYAKKTQDASARLIGYSTTEKNKFESVTILAHDLSIERKVKWLHWAQSELSVHGANVSDNLIHLHWANGYSNILGIAELITFMGPPEMFDPNTI